MSASPAAALADDARARGLRRVLIITLVLNLAVALGKIVVGTLADAISVRADGFHSSTDGLNNIVLLVATAWAAAPPDKDHPYGHKKFELFASVAIALSLLAIAASIGHDVTVRLRGDVDAAPHIDALTLGVMITTLVINVFVALWERSEAKRLQSPALASDAAHTASDIAVTLSVLVGALFVRAGYVVVDAFASVLVAGFIGYTGIGILKDNLRFLSDVALVDADAVVAAARRIDGVSVVHDVRSRGTPGHVFVDLNIHVDGGLSVKDAHDLAHAVEARVRADIAGVADVHVHIEPA